MSSDDTPSIRRRTRKLNTSDAPGIPSKPDKFDPGPMINYPPLPLGPDGLPRAPDIRQRIRDLRILDKRASKEFILRTLHAFLLAHRPMDEIARTFGVGVRMVYLWRRELNSLIGKELRDKKPIDVLGGQLMHYERTKAYAWQQASTTRDHTQKRGWVTIAMKAESEITNIYCISGVYQSNMLRPKTIEDGEEKPMLIEMSNQFMIGGHAGVQKLLTAPVNLDEDIVGEYGTIEENYT